MEQLRFVFKNSSVKTTTTKARTYSDADIGLSYSKNGTKGDLVTVTFRNGTADKIAPNTKAVAWAISGAKMYFTETTKEQGYKLCKVREGENRYLQLAGKKHTKETKWAKKHAGQYPLLKDETRGLYYIDTEALIFTTKIGGEAIR